LNGYWLSFIIIAVAVFFAGFYTYKLLDKSLLRHLQEEMEDLKLRLQDAERLLSEKASRMWPGMELSVESSDSGIEDAFEGRAALGFDETQISEEEPAGLEIKSSGPESGIHSAFRPSVPLTQVIGQGNGVKLRKTILGSKALGKARELPQALVFAMIAVLFAGSLLVLLSQLELTLNDVVSTIIKPMGKPSEHEDTTQKSNTGYLNRSEGEIDSPTGNTVEENINRAIHELEKGQFVTAMKFFEEAFISEPSLTDRMAIPYARALRGYASELLETEPERARALTEKAIELDSESAQAHFQLGKIDTKLENYDKAIEAYLNAANLDPRFSDAFFNLGYVYAVTGDYPKAEETFKRCIELAPTYLDEVYFNLAMVQRKQGKQHESNASLNMSLDINPENPLAKKYFQQPRKD
jgi:tetratricopeptide (TPR) repeat protein